MTRILFLIFVAALVPLESHADDGDACLYNQDAFKEMYVPIKEKYKHTKFIKKEQALEIQFGDSKVIVRYFGCEHYGTEIKYYENGDRAYTDKEILEKSIELVTRFGQERINPGVLDGLLKSGKYEKVEGHAFFINYPGMDEFSITVDRHSGRPLIEIGFYN